MDTHWTIDQESLEKAVSSEYLDLQYPVIITPTDQPWVGKYHGIGYHGPGPEGTVITTEVPTHFVQVQGDIAAVWANRCAWHELTHAAQAESLMPEGEVDELGVPRWKSGIRLMTNLYGYEATEVKGFKPGEMLPGYSYTGISFEKDANDGMKHANEVSILVPNKDQEVIWRVDCINNKDNEAKTYYIICVESDTAVKYVKDKYLTKDNWKWDLCATLTPRAVERNAA